MTSRDVHVRLGWLFAPGWRGAVGGGRAVLGTIAELGGNAADAGRVRAPSTTSARAYGRAHRAPAHTILAGHGGFGSHVLPTQLLSGS